MNKKVLTLCAGFLLAGGMLSNLSAKVLTDADANSGKYFKMKYALWHNNTTWAKCSGAYYLDVNESTNAFSLVESTDDVWQVTKGENGQYIFTSLTGKVLKVDETEAFEIFTTGVNADGLAGFQLKANNDYVAQEIAATAPYDVVWQTKDGPLGTKTYGLGFDAVETTLESVTAVDPLTNGKTYRFWTKVDGEWYDSAIFKASYDDSNDTWSFTYNANDNVLVIDNENHFKKVTTDGGVYFEIPTGGKFIYWNVEEGKFELKSSLAEATLFAFSETSTETVSISAQELNWYEKDGFSVTIKYQDKDGNFTKTDIEGNPFVGHLTPMIYLAGKMQPATSNQYSFFLKNEEGKYIVAKANMVGQQKQSYKFETIEEIDLLRELSVNTLDKTYFGMFSADALRNEYERNPQALSQLANLYVIVGGDLLRVGNLVEDNVPTLKAATDDYWSGLGLKPIKIELSSGTLVNAKNLLKDKFFTVELVKGLGTAKGFLTANGTVYSTFATSAGNSLEQQWALTYRNGNYIFTNRENKNITYSFDGDKLYTTNEANTYSYNSATYVIKTVDTESTDGYVTLPDVKNHKFNIGYASSVYGESWFTENHEGTNNHTIGLNTEIDNASVWTATEYAAERKSEEQKDFKWNYTPTDSIYVISELDYYAGDTKKTKLDTLKIVSYSFVNEYNEALLFDGSKYVASSDKNTIAQKFALRKDGENLNLRLVSLEAKVINDYKGQESALADKMYNTFNNAEDLSKVYAGDANNGRLVNHDLYTGNDWDLFTISETEKPMYRKVVNNLDTISIFRQENDKQMLFEDGKFLGLKNATQFDFAPAMLADTAYVRYNTYRPQYLLAVDPVMHGETTWCPEHGYGATCQHAQTIKGYVEGRYLVNLVDTAIAWDKANKHKDGNPYINSEKYYRLGFVQATHRNDSLIIANDNNRIFLGNNDYNLAKFAFRYVDQNAGSFVIETANYNRLPNATKAEINGVGYIKWMNGVVVVVDKMEDADVFNMNENEEGNPTANENISAGNVVVAGVNGAVVVKGAEGKNVIVSTILGKVVANEVVSSDNATIAAPQGVVVVSVDGESFKVVVK